MSNININIEGSYNDTNIVLESPGSVINITKNN